MSSTKLQGIILCIIISANFIFISTIYNQETENEYHFYGDVFIPAYSGGNGYDYDALHFMNVPEAWVYRATEISSPYTTVIEPKIAVIDTGLDGSVWNILEQTYYVDIYFIKMYAYCVAYDPNNNCYQEEVGVMSTTNPSSSFVKDPVGHGNWVIYMTMICIMLHEGFVKDPVGHGNWVTSVVAQTAQFSSIYVVSVADHDDSANDYPLRSDFIQKAYEVLYANGNPAVDVISMSYGGSSYVQSEDETLTSLHNAGVELFAAVGNEDKYESKYPASYSVVRGVSGIYDDKDGSMTNGQTLSSSYVGDRISKTKTSTLMVGNRAVWGSSYSSAVRFASPGFDVEVFGEGGSHHVVDGTSFSTPFVAAIALLVMDLLLDAGYDLSSPDYRGAVYYILELTAQGFYGDHVNAPVMNYNPSTVMWSQEFGHGTVDAYDAVVYAVEIFGAPQIIISSPVTSSVSGTVPITAEVYDDTGISLVEIFINNVLVFSGSSGPYMYYWNTINYPTSSVIKVIATDIDGKITEALKYVTVSNGGGGCSGCPE